VFLIFNRFPDRERPDINSLQGRKIEAGLTTILAKDESTTQLLAQSAKLSHAYPLLALGRASWRYVPRDEIAAPTGCFY
jgi:hypothetical protein